MTSCACVEGLELYAGRSYTLKFTFTTSNPTPATPMDLTGAKLWFSVKERTSDTDADALITKENAAAGGDDSEIKVIDATGGVAEVYIQPDDTKDLDEGDFWFDVVIENSSNKVMQGVAPSRFHIKYTVTKVV